MAPAPAATRPPEEERGAIVFHLPRPTDPPRRRASFAAAARAAAGGEPSLRELLLSEAQHGLPPGLGTFAGVFVPCTCTIFGVVVFLRLGVVVGHAGAWGALLVVAAAFLLTLLTTLSLCALISDGTDAPGGGGGGGATPSRGPGVYAALRKSVGRSLGTALGAAFYLAFVTDVAFYVVGFAETMREGLGARSSVQVFPWNPPGTWIDEAIGSSALALLAAICSRGVHFSARVSLFTLVAIVACIATSLGCLLLPSYDEASGYTALSLATWEANEWPDFSNTTAFPSLEGGSPSVILMFVLVFPGFTGVLAGSNLSENLRTPSRSIALGSLSSLCFVLATYAAICCTLAATVDRHVLKTNMMIMNTVVQASLKAPIGYIGVACTTLSSALSYLVGAPRVLQAVARDLKSPFWLPLAATSSRGEPLAALALTCVLVQLILLTGTVNLLAPLVTGVFLLTFCLINLVCFIASVSRPTFAPTFRLYSPTSAFLGAVLSLTAMVVSLSSTTLSGASGAVTAGVCALLLSLVWWRREALLALLMQGVWERDVDVPVAPPDGLSERLQRAEAYVRDAMQGRYREALWHGAHSRIKSRLLLRNLKVLRVVNLTVYMGLGFFERPAWCYGLETCGDPKMIPVSDFAELPLWASQLIESICIALFLGEMSLKVHYMKTRAFFASTWHVVQLFILCFEAAGIAISAISPTTATFLNPMLRPLLFITMNASVRHSFCSFLRVIPAVADCIVLVLLLLAFFATTGVLLFAPEFNQGDDGRYFESIPLALNSLLVMLTTANFPDVMLRAYAQRRASCIFFIVFLLLGLFLLMNLILAAVFRNYKAQVASRERYKANQRRRAFDAAFSMLDLNSNGYVELREVSMLLARVQQPAFGVFDRSGSAMDTARTHARLAHKLQTDEMVPVRGVGPEAFRELVGTLRVVKVGSFGDNTQFLEEARQQFQEELLAASRGTIAPSPDADRQLHAYLEQLRQGDNTSPRLSEEVHTPFGVASALRLARPPAAAAAAAAEEEGLVREESLAAAAEWLAEDPAAEAWRDGRPRRARVSGRLEQLFGRRVGSFVGSLRFERFVDVVVVLNAFTLLVQVQLGAIGDTSAMHAVDKLAAPLFDGFFGLEMCVRFLHSRMAGGRGQWPLASLHDSFGCFVTILTIGADAILYVLPHKAAKAGLRVCLGLRALRMLRLLASIQRANNLFRNFVTLLPAFSALFGAFWAVISLYAQLGCTLFGGKLSVESWPDPQNPMYVYCNFNDFGSALVTLFYLLVVNNWFVVMEAVVALTSDWARVYFISWYLLAVVVMSNLVVAQILDAFFDSDEAASEDQSQASDGGNSWATTPCASFSVNDSLPPRPAVSATSPVRPPADLPADCQEGSSRAEEQAPHIMGDAQDDPSSASRDAQCAVS